MKFKLISSDFHISQTVIFHVEILKSENLQLGRVQMIQSELD
jgi:hypothetical protein